MSPLICCSVNIDFAWTIGHVQYLGTHCVLGWFRVVVGWRGVTTCHLVPPGSGVEPSMPPNNHLRHYQPCAMLGKRLAATKHLHFIAIFTKLLVFSARASRRECFGETVKNLFKTRCIVQNWKLLFILSVHIKYHKALPFHNFAKAKSCKVRLAFLIKILKSWA